MRAIYLTEFEQRFYDVYPREIKEQIEKIFDIKDFRYHKDLLNDKDFQDVEYIFSTWYMPVLTEEEIKKIFPSLKAIFYSAGTVQAFARPFLNLGIKVFSAWHANAVPVIEYSVSQILLATKGFYYLTSLTKKSFDQALKEKINFKGNYNNNIGILGYGAIGRKVVEELLRHKLNIYVFAPNLSQEEADRLGIHKSNLDEIFDKCNVISNHLGNLPEIQKIIDARLINKLRDYTTFINTGRGQQVDENALIRKLEENKTICAVLDVFDPEPPVKDSKFFTLENAIITPHIAGSEGNEVQRMSQYMIDECKRYLKGEKCFYEVTLEMLKTMA